MDISHQASIAVATAFAVAVTGCSSHAHPVSQHRTPVRVESATTGPAMPPISTHGVVANKDEIHLSFKVAGFIKLLNVEEGQAVRRGQRLAQIELTEINAQVAQARAASEKAQRDLRRGERLYSDQVISLEQLQDLRTQAAIQTAQLARVQFNRGYSAITSPSDGIVLRKLALEREFVSAGQTVLIVGARDRGYVVRAALSDRELVQLKLGDAGEARMDAYPGRTFAGTLTEISNAADERTGLFPVEVRLDSPPAVLASGMVAKLRLLPAAFGAQLPTYVPLGAIIEGDQDRATVFVIAGDRAKRREVRVAFVGPAGVALAAGIRPGERIVTDGAPYLEDNEPIEVVPDATKIADNAPPTVR